MLQRSYAVAIGAVGRGEGRAFAPTAESYSQGWCSNVHDVAGVSCGSVLVLLLLRIVLQRAYAVAIGAVERGAACMCSYCRKLLTGMVLQRAYDVAGVSYGEAYLCCCC